MRSFRLTPAFLLLALGLGLGLTACEDFLGEGDEPLRELADRFTLPGDDVFPEGIAFNDGDNVFYVGSTTNGTLYEVALDGDTVEVLSDGPPTAIGLAYDDDVLYVAGGGTGRAYAYDTDDGELIDSFLTPTPDGGTFINDVAVAGNGDAYFTDSFRPVLFRLEDTDADSLEAWLDLTGTDITYGEGFNLNGIAVTDDGDYLIVVQSNTGDLFRIYTDTTDVADDEEIVMPIDVGGADLTNGDGLVLDGQMLYVVRNQNEEIVPIELADDFLMGDVGGAITSEALMYPTTAARISSRSLLVVNAQFDERGEGGSPTLPFDVVRVRTSR